MTGFVELLVLITFAVSRHGLGHRRCRPSRCAVMASAAQSATGGPAASAESLMPALLAGRKGVRFDDGDGAGGAVDHGVADRAEQHRLEGAPAARADHHQAGVGGGVDQGDARRGSPRRGSVTVSSGWVACARSAADSAIRSAEARSSCSSTSLDLVSAGAGDDLQRRRRRGGAVGSEVDGGRCLRASRRCRPRPGARARPRVAAPRPSRRSPGTWPGRRRRTRRSRAAPRRRVRSRGCPGRPSRRSVAGLDERARRAGRPRWRRRPTGRGGPRGLRRRRGAVTSSAASSAPGSRWSSPGPGSTVMPG